MYRYRPSLILVSALLAKVSSGQSDSWLGWNDLEPSTSLNFTKCYNDQYKCAKLTVPLDWLNPNLETSTQVNIAVIALPATVDEDDPSFGGTIITNPGGPGGEGVTSVAIGTQARAIQLIADGDKHYEVMSFDPRGVGLSTPNVDCYKDPLARYMNDREFKGMGNWTANDDVFRRYMAKQKQLSRRCELVGQEDEHDIRYYMSTTTVARDMLYMVDKLDELRNGGENKANRSKADLPRLQYWGFSYGTALGNYFASMFPGRVERMVLEGVVDIYDYSNATWIAGAADLSKAYQYLWDTCFAKKQKCPLYKPEDTSASDIRNRVEDWLEELDKDPAIWVDGTRDQVITSWEVYQSLFNPVTYIPTMTWGFLSEAIADMMRGNFETFMGWTSLPGVGATCPIQLSQYRAEWNAEAFRAIACGDGPDQTNVSLDEFKLHIERLHQISPKLGTFSAHRAACLGWRYRPEDRFTGPWGSPRPDKSRVEGKPTAPLLFTSSEIDTVTPLRAAFEMSKLHEGSGVLVHEGSGHSIIAIPSECRHRWLRRYWATGELPPNGTVCKMECEPFEDCAYIPQLEPEAALSGASDMRKRAAWVARSWAEIPGINEFRL